jgi:DNA-binding transcriptional regulator YhcF (GntR family)
MIDRHLLEQVFDTKIIHVIEALINHPTEFFSIRELADQSNVTISTTFRIVQSLEKVGFVKKVARGRIKYFQIQRASKSYKQFSDFLGQEQSTEIIVKAKLDSLYDGADVEIYLPKKDKDKIFLITEEDLDDAHLSIELTTSLGRKVKAMSISPKQFDKMKKIGLV